MMKPNKYKQIVDKLREARKPYGYQLFNNPMVMKRKYDELDYLKNYLIHIRNAYYGTTYRDTDNVGVYLSKPALDYLIDILDILDNEVNNENR